MSADPHHTLLISRIPVERREADFVTNPLWSRDINTNAQVVSRITLICPLQPATDAKLQPLDPRITVIDAATLDRATLERLVKEADVVEIPGNPDWRGARLGRQAMRLARRHSKTSVLGISSNRARTTVLNAVGRGPVARVRAWLRATSIRLSQRYLARRCDGVRIVGDGLRPLVEGDAKSLHVETASWIRQEDFHPPEHAADGPVQMVMAARLEPMKGLHIGISALASLVAEGADIRLWIIGEGAEEARLRAQIATAGLDPHTEFLGTLDYPGPFFETLRKARYVLLTNLNDEQPRLIFDAISQGAIPVCPAGRAYKALGIDARLLYEQGNAEALAATLRALIALPPDAAQALQDSLTAFASARTLEAMHRRRLDWVRNLTNRSRA